MKKKPGWMMLALAVFALTISSCYGPRYVEQRDRGGRHYRGHDRWERRHHGYYDGYGHYRY